jgi:hypothetical protein
LKKGKDVHRKDAKIAKKTKIRMEKDPLEDVAVLGELCGFAVK